MSTAAQSPLMSPGSSGYSFARARGKCSICAGDIAPGEKFTAAVRETDAGLERLDLDATCWESFDRAPLLAFWHATMPTGPVAKPKVFVDDSVLCDLFQRLSEAGDGPAKVNFRFVLGLILMRKRLISYEATHFDDDKEFWTVRMKGSDAIIDLLNPRLDEQQIAEVSAQLSSVLSGEAA
jgi:hypothetical protein